MASGAVIGSALGLGIQLYANAVRKLPLMRNPWEHVLFIGAGAYAGNWLVEFEERTGRELEEILAARAKANKGVQFRATHNQPERGSPVQ